MKRINIEQSRGIGYTIQQRRLAVMRWNEEPKGKSEKDSEEKKEEPFSFLQETIKPEPIAHKQVREKLIKLAVCGVLVGMFACLGFYALKPWAQKLFPGSPRTVTLPEDTEETQDTEEEKPQEKKEEPQILKAEDYESMMQSVYKIAADAGKSIVTVYGEKELGNLTADSVESCTGIIAADNGQELLILSNNSVCAGSSVWNVKFSDGNQYEATLKKQDMNSHLAVFGVKREQIKKSTWEGVRTACFGKSNLVTQGEMVIAVGNMFGYSDGLGYGIISSNVHEKSIPDHTFGVLATDIPAAERCSGVLCNLRGEIIGLIDSEIWPEDRGTTVNAYAISDLKSTMELLLNSQSVPYVGLYGETVSSDISKSKAIPSGMYVTQVQADSPAMAAGIQSGDVIQMVNGTKITTMAQYEEALQACKADTNIQIKGQRLGAGKYVDISFQVTVGSRE